MNLRLLMTFTMAISFCFEAHSRDGENKPSNYPPQLDGARVEVYKNVGDVELNVYIYNPADHKPTDRRPVAVFFFGGGWKAGTPKQFEHQCEYLASRGMVAMTADYRVLTRHGTKAKECVADAKSAIRWIRQEATRLGIDPDRLVAAGGSAGGHVAACTGVIKGFDDSSDNLSLSAMPNALALFNPALVLAQVDGRDPLPADTMPTLPERMGVAPKALSPYHHVKLGVPPTIIFHGKADPTVPYKSAEQFAEAMQKAGNRCELVGYEDQPHGFFNYGQNENRYFKATLASLDNFLVSLGYLNGAATAGTPQP